MCVQKLVLHPPSFLQICPVKRKTGFKPPRFEFLVCAWLHTSTRTQSGGRVPLHSYTDTAVHQTDVGAAAKLQYVQQNIDV